jgi:hypothetical protein
VCSVVNSCFALTQQLHTYWKRIGDSVVIKDFLEAFATIEIWTFVRLINCIEMIVIYLYLISHINAGASNSEICNGWRNARLFACKGFDFASKIP